MIRLNRTTEYGLIALWHMSRKKSTHVNLLTTAREISDHYGLPFEITAKTLQRLKNADFIHSSHGAKGGYYLKKNLKDVSFADFLSLMEGGQSLVICTFPREHPEDGSCEYRDRCEIKSFMSSLNQRMVQFLANIRLSELEEFYSNNNGKDLSANIPVSLLVSQKEALKT